MAETKKKAPAKKTSATKKKVVAEVVKEPVKEVVKEPEIFNVKVTAHLLNVRKAPGYDAEILKVIACDSLCEIVETFDNWGKLANDEGWICLDFAEKNA